MDNDTSTTTQNVKRNTALIAAKAAKNDEFYTQLDDIETELKHYLEHFEDKTVFLNCDDPRESNFWVYFNNNFEPLGLKKLISTHYESTGKPSYALIQERERERE